MTKQHASPPPRSGSGASIASSKNGMGPGHHHLIRTTAFFAGLDANLQLGLACVFVLYLVVTIGTFSRLPSPHNAILNMASSGHRSILARRAQVLLHGKLYEPATTADQLQALIQQEEDKLKALGGAAAAATVNHHNPHHDAYLAGQQQQANNQQANNQQALPNEDAIHFALNHAVLPVQVDYAEIAKVQATFPVRASDDTELIDHPGYPYADKQAFGNTPPEPKMKVPRYWNPPAYGGDVRKYLGDYGRRLLTMQEALSIGSKTPDGQETIYITIASYRDPGKSICILEE